MADWYYQTEKGTEAGPISNSELKNLVSSGAVTPATLLRKDDAKWVNEAIGVPCGTKRAAILRDVFHPRILYCPKLICCGSSAEEEG